MLERVVKLKRGDTFKEITDFGGGRSAEFLLKVQDVNTDHDGKDYLWAYYAKDELNVDASTTITLEDGQKSGRVAMLPVEMQLSDRKVKIEKTKAPKGTKWSYDFGK